jgi:hypothetical protein
MELLRAPIKIKSQFKPTILAGKESEKAYRTCHGCGPQLGSQVESQLATIWSSSGCRHRWINHITIRVEI